MEEDPHPSQTHTSPLSPPRRGTTTQSGDEIAGGREAVVGARVGQVVGQVLEGAYEVSERERE